MSIGRCTLTWAALAALLALPACGKTFPFGERLLPETYGPPFGSALKDTIPEHPHNPAHEERHAAPYAAENKRYASHQACHDALVAKVREHGGSERDVVRISSIESMGHATQAGVTHEHRCNGYVLSYRSWQTGDGHGEAHGDGHSGGNEDH
jgi:hypothetical protein